MIAQAVKRINLAHASDVLKALFLASTSYSQFFCFIQFKITI
jgi:hypothetical protein